MSTKPQVQIGTEVLLSERMAVIIEGPWEVRRGEWFVRVRFTDGREQNIPAERVR